jgi:hypothetical protein
MNNRIRNVVATFSFTAVASLLSACLPHSDLASKEDGGPSVYNDFSMPTIESSLLPESIANDLPLVQQATVFTLGGGVRGIGMLAELRPDSKGQIRAVIARKTNLSKIADEPYTPITLVRLISPNGTLVDYAELTDQSDEVSYVELTADDASAGIWRLSFSGGRAGDLVEMRLPATAIWGVRGEMALGVTKTTPGVQGKAYIWSPPTAEIMMVGIESGSDQGIELRSLDDQILAQPKASKARRVACLIPKQTPVNEIVELVLPDDFNGTISVEGIPGLLCPSIDAANILKGGMVESEGRLLAGPLQARARKYSVYVSQQINRDLHFELPREIPEKLTNLPYHVLGFGKYAPLNHLTSMVEMQNANLDPMDPGFGGFKKQKEKTITPEKVETEWKPLGGVATFDAGSLAGAVTFDSELNPAFQSKELVDRATLAAFANLANLQGDDLLREPSLITSTYPIVHVLFTYPIGMAMPYEQLHPYLKSEANEIWKQGVMAMGDKLADYQAYESNQWAHMMSGHLNVYLATREPRFLGYFERQAVAYFKNTYGPGSKFGQHPAGYYLEECGPDGNYDKLNSFCVAEMYYSYKDLPEAKPELVELMKSGIQKSLRFNSFFWLPQPDGSIAGPNAMNCRKTAYLGGAGYPGAVLPKSDFPLAAARYALTKNVHSGMGTAGTFSWAANNQDWIRLTISECLRLGAGAWEDGSGAWLPVLTKCFGSAQIVEPGLLPIEEEKTWELPGMLAWNQNGIYGMVFNDVVGRTRKQLDGITGGAPSALWTRECGTFLSSMHPGEHVSDSNKLTRPEEITFAAIYGTDDKGQFFYSGKEAASTESNPSDDIHVISSELNAPKITIQWRYDRSDDTLMIGVRMSSKALLQQCFVNLPMANFTDQTSTVLIARDTVMSTAPHGRVRTQWRGDEGTLQSSVNDKIQRLVVPIKPNGEWVWFTFQTQTIDDIAPIVAKQ